MVVAKVAYMDWRVLSGHVEQGDWVDVDEWVSFSWNHDVSELNVCVVTSGTHLHLSNTLGVVCAKSGL